MKKQVLLFVLMPALFLVFCQNSFGQVKQVYGFYYTYDLRRTNNPDIEVCSKAFGFSNQLEYYRKFFEDTLPCVYQLKKSKVFEMYDSVYKFHGFIGDAKQKHLDSMFVKMCSPEARISIGDSIKITYINTLDANAFNYDLRIGYYNGRMSKGLVWYQVENYSPLGVHTGKYSIVGNNKTFEYDNFDAVQAVKDMIQYESIKRKLAKLVPVKPVTTGAVTYTQQEKKGGKIVVKILDDATDTVVKKIVIKKDTVNPLAVSQPEIFPIAYNFKSALVRSYQMPNLPVVIVEPVSVIDSNLLNDDSAAQEKEIAKFYKEVKVNKPPKKNAIAAKSVMVKPNFDSSKFVNSNQKVIKDQKKSYEDEVARVKKTNKATTDSLIAENKKVAIELAYYKKQDSIRNQKEKARKDSIANVEEQKRISDSTKNAIAIENEKARVSDSVAKVTALALYVLDTTQKGIYARRISDSTTTAKHVQDSLVRAVDSVARATDSIKNATASLELKLKRAQEERDSIARIIAVKEKPEPVYRNAEPKVFPKVNNIPYPVIREPEVSPIAVSKIPPQAKDEKFKIIKVVDSTTYDPYGRPVRHSHYVIQKK